MPDEYAKNSGSANESLIEPTAAMKRIAGYILEFQAKYRQLEEEQRRQREERAKGDTRN
jgi:hypothetical protein